MIPTLDQLKQEQAKALLTMGDLSQQLTAAEEIARNARGRVEMLRGAQGHTSRQLDRIAAAIEILEAQAADAAGQSSDSSPVS